jgi:3-methyladenine DNA glycosylase/8-oxoguanine DNA glycosylase
MAFEIELRTPFDLTTANEYFGGWLPFSSDPAAVAMAFPVEGRNSSAAVVLRQPSTTRITGEVYNDGEDDAAALAWQQALAVLSLDSDGIGWPEVGKHDAVIGRLQEAYSFLRPVLFHSPYEAAAAFMIGHRISIRQGRAIRLAMAEQVGDKIQVGDQTLHAFPRPEVLRELTSFQGINAEKIERLHGIAQEALEGLLDRSHLRSIPTEQALEQLCTLKGVGQFFSQGILMRGAGLNDEVPDDEVTKEAVQLSHDLPNRPSHQQVLDIAEAWRPYRMWAAVLQHVWLRRDEGGPKRKTP